MGFLSKLFGGDKDVEKAAKDFLNGILDGQNAQSAPSAPSAQNAAAQNAWEQSQPSAPASFYDAVPAEENQYNSGLPYTEYFEGIFAADFPQYRVEKTPVKGGRRIVYTFFTPAAKVLCVELMPESSSAAKIRSDCKRDEIAYLRFYIDHEGWWNTRSYVVERISNALK